MPVLLEEFLDEIERMLKDQIDEKKILQLHRELDDPLLENEDLKSKLFAFVEYVKEIPHLPEPRKRYRVGKTFEMIEKLRRWYLVEYLSCFSAEKIDLSTDVQYARGVGPGRKKKLKKLGIETLKDLLEFFPRDYEDRRKVLKLNELVPGRKVTTQGKISSVEKKKFQNMNILVAVLSDGLMHVLLKWFNQDFLHTQLKQLIGKEVFVTGIVKLNPYTGQYEIHNAEVLPKEREIIRRIFPIYRLTSGISQKQMRRIFEENIPSLCCSLEETLPERIIKKRNLLSIKDAYYGMHFPKTLYHLEKARERLAYEELFTLQLAFQKVRREREKHGGIPKKIEGRLAEEFIKSLPFQLTGAQKRAHEEIRRDMVSEKPMNRLLQGDVGSGKTVVAQLAILDNHEAGFQAAFMVPTSILAIQHYRRTVESFSRFDIRVALLIGATSLSEKEKIKSGLKNGQIDLVIGTHALIQEDVHFKNLGLVIIDEQHRFGVRQREALMNKGRMVDTLVMSATPIPRSMALAFYGDLDVTVIDEMPPGRKEVQTILVSMDRVNEVYEFVRQGVMRGGQAFIVYPLIEESDKLNVKSAVEMYEYLSKEVFPEFRVGLMHGKLSQEEKDRVMMEFAEGRYDILVSTTVIEVGIDVPRANVMVIENPERFGLAQLHQLRGRVGRGGQEAYCFLVVGDVGEEAMERLRFFTLNTDGFKIAEYDLKTRGPGEFFGLKQHGMSGFKVANLYRDLKLLEWAREDVQEIDVDKINLPEEIKLIEVG
ncbi:ATP-dependent DNA helicase RecG [Thermotoga sp. SG1]|nr:ATP-dependent DNA helicase RecG [Thermotoga sp. SG1]